ncbi:multidrug efflux system outer membrane protein [Catalinimonas alkaloidigena]|uniref:efflux transporter outer membrane subunit n=1 Tax=Catalinimonas alkaloidigena TaxID=1075417 RepID=UPI0024059496|nr:efflux transporter outer membrane subunit [Catalinimonas alkaloidigena]MDF9796551.1 multidrug efflux system outer membrane protein [Catalinimonas alkaloidigena]
MKIEPSTQLKLDKVVCHFLRTDTSGLLLFFMFLVSIVFFSACSPKTTQAKLPVETPQPFTYTGKEVPTDAWWTSFNDQRLNTLVEQAIGTNMNLTAVWFRFKEAQAVVDRQSSFLLPDVEASIRSSLNRPQPDFVGGENVQLGLSAFYEVDLWGRISALIKAEKFRAEATFADYQAASISLSAEITSTWYQLMAEWQQLELIDEQINTNQKILDFIKAQFGSGQIRSVDILRQQQLVEASREQKIQTESRIEVLEHQLAVLLGMPAQNEIEYVPDSLPDLPPLPDTGIPSELLARRPDVQSAFKLLQASDREVASAISNRYPRLSISTSAQLRANNFDNLLEDWAYSLGGNLVAPLFYGGRLNAEVDRTQAVKNQRLYEYGQTVLVAFQEVEDALIQERKQLESIEVLKVQVELATRAYQQLEIEYFNGLSDYLAVLTALNQEQQLRRDLITANSLLLEYRIALYRALAGGFTTERELETES